MGVDKKLKKIIRNRDFWLIIIVLIFGFYTGFFQNLFKYSGRGSPIFSPSNLTYLEIDYGSKRRAFEGEIMFEMSVLDALLAASRGGGFEVRYAILNDTTDVMKINDITEDGLNGESWNFYLNGRKVETGLIHKTPIRSGDKILVKFE